MIDKFFQITTQILHRYLTIRAIILTQKGHIRYIHIHVLYRYNKTVKVCLFRDTGNDHSAMYGNKPGLGGVETSYIPHNHTLTV